MYLSHTCLVVSVLIFFWAFCLHPLALQPVSAFTILFRLCLLCITSSLSLRLAPLILSLISHSFPHLSFFPSPHSLPRISFSPSPLILSLTSHSFPHLS